MRWLGSFVVLVALLVPRAAWAADFTVTNTGMTAYNINGQDNPPLSLVRGHAYTFQVTSTGHPFFIKTAQVTGTGSTWDEGVVNNGVTSGTLTFTVPADAPATLFYQCSIHSVMTGTIAVAAAPVPALYPLAFALLALLLGGAGWSVLRGRRLPTRHIV